MVHCQCANDLAGSNALDNTQCNSQNVANTHCVGPYMAGEFMLGSHGTGSVYRVEKQAVPAPTQPTKLVYKLAPEMGCKSGGAWSRPGGNVPTTEEGVQ